MNTKTDKKLMKRADLIPALNCIREAANRSKQWDELLVASLKVYGEHGSQISGCGREHFPEAIKDMLRDLAHGVTEWNDKALANRPKGVRVETMHKLARAVCRTYGSGFYGYRV